MEIAGKNLCKSQGVHRVLRNLLTHLGYWLCNRYWQIVSCDFSPRVIRSVWCFNPVWFSVCVIDFDFCWCGIESTFWCIRIDFSKVFSYRLYADMCTIFSRWLSRLCHSQKIISILKTTSCFSENRYFLRGGRQSQSRSALVKRTLCLFLRYLSWRTSEIIPQEFMKKEQSVCFPWIAGKRWLLK